MLAKANHLRKASDITRVYKRGSYGAGGGLFSLKAARTGSAASRAVVVVSKKVAKRAVVRNRIRRRLAAFLQEIWTTVPDGYDIVISVHAAEAAELPANELRGKMAGALRAARVTGLNPKD